MKVKVLKRFNDRVTHERREAGKTYDYPDKRVEELVESGFVEIIGAKEEKKG